MRQRSGGFTLIELITVIVILGVIAAVAVPRFIDLQDNAARAATEGVAGNLASASSVNLAGALAGDTAAIEVTNCTNVAGALQGGTPDGYVIKTGAVTGSTGEAATCTVEDTSEATTATFRAFAVPTPPSP